VLGLYLALLDVWQDAADAVAADRPPPRALAGWAGVHVLPRVVKATEAAGPTTLATAARDLVAAGPLDDALGTWLAGGGLPPVERYLARATLWPVLVALGEAAGEACQDDPAPRGDRHCTRCGGPAQVSCRSGSDDRLVSGNRLLVCARCGHRWPYSGSACPACGDPAGARRTVYAERGAAAAGRGAGAAGRRDEPVVGRAGVHPESGPADDADGAPMFPHLRVDACAACARYVIDVDLGRDAGAVPEVDELAAVPLALYAADQGLSKLTPNLMGL
jgi:hypothetical protein